MIIKQRFQATSEFDSRWVTNISDLMPTLAKISKF